MDAINRNDVGEFDEGKLNAIIAGLDAFLMPLDRTIIRTVAENPHVFVNDAIIIAGNRAPAAVADILAALRNLSNAKGGRSAYIRCGTHDNCVGNRHHCTLVLSELGRAMINLWDGVGEGAPQRFPRSRPPDVPDEPTPEQPRPREMEW